MAEKPKDQLPDREDNISLSGVRIEDALRSFMQVDPAQVEEAEKRAKKAAKARRQRKKRKES